jgi:hypothetical protein
MDIEQILKCRYINCFVKIGTKNVDLVYAAWSWMTVK